MTAVLLIAIYCVGLTAFLGLDIIGRVPATLYAPVLAGLGALSAVALVGALEIAARPDANAFATASAALVGVAAGGGLMALGRLVTIKKKS